MTEAVSYHGLKVVKSGAEPSSSDFSMDEEYNPSLNNRGPDFVLKGLSGVDSAYDAELVVPFKPQNGETYFLLALYYGDGDSFTTHHHIFHPVMVFKTLEKAQRMKHLIIQDDKIKDYHKLSGLCLLNEINEPEQMAAPWDCFFGFIEEVFITPLQYQEESSSWE